MGNTNGYFDGLAVFVMAAETEDQSGRVRAFARSTRRHAASVLSSAASTPEAVWSGLKKTDAKADELNRKVLDKFFNDYANSQHRFVTALEWFVCYQVLNYMWGLVWAAIIAVFASMISSIFGFALGLVLNILLGIYCAFCVWMTVRALRSWHAYRREMRDIECDSFLVSVQATDKAMEEVMSK